MRANADAVVAAIKAAGHSVQGAAAGFDAPAGYAAATRPASEAATGDYFYPVTESQYAGTAGASSSSSAAAASSSAPPPAPTAGAAAASAWEPPTKRLKVSGPESGIGPQGPPTAST